MERLLFSLDARVDNIRGKRGILMAHTPTSSDSPADNSESTMDVHTTVLDDGATSTANSPTFAALGVHSAIVEALSELSLIHI